MLRHEDTRKGGESHPNERVDEGLLPRLIFTRAERSSERAKGLLPLSIRQRLGPLLALLLLAEHGVKRVVDHGHQLGREEVGRERGRAFGVREGLSSVSLCDLRGWIMTSQSLHRLTGCPSFRRLSC